MAASAHRTAVPRPLLGGAGSPDERIARVLPGLGLRERKKLKTRMTIRAATYRLVGEQGWEATTVEQIAELAEVSPSTVFRYFPTKEDIVLTDEFDPVLEEQLRSRPADEDPLDSLLAVFREGMAAFADSEGEAVVQRTALLLNVPAVRARMTETMAETSRVLIRAVADRSGLPPDDLKLRIFTAAVLGALREALVVWAEGGHERELMDLVDEAFGVLRDGPGMSAPSRA
ncbi:TetR/AcrR family transcriptional regulator [Streptomyces qinzhouensis]|uniref:TetR family transcriptional regulator n=1 Tax=Streptomyces qinzhouensis TaxID=2599401 RepID=A0A5B8JLU6_9ACTN|nr:TetR family transcriptional regulator [Streptomyces qinzhouensis]QDY78730.1 TetR family transcriptional regulator [Streptomyces qinzhouensis]